MQPDPRSPEPSRPPSRLEAPAPLPLTKEDVPVVYAALLRALHGRADLGAAKADLRAAFGCSPKALDGVQAQLTKDLEIAFRASPEAHDVGTAADVMRRTAWNYRCYGGSPDYEPHEGYAQFMEAFGGICHQRGVGLLWEHLTGNSVRWGTVAGAGQAPYRGAAHADFDFPVKVVWRAEWEAFLREKLSGLPPGEVNDLKVLCFPSKDPRRELPIYLRLGFRPENIFAVEGNADASAELTRNLQILGGDYSRVNVVPSDLLQFLKRTREVFDVISLDFHGCYGLNKEHVYQALRPAPTHYVLVNLEAAREKDIGKQLLREVHDMRQNPLAMFHVAVANTGGQALDETNNGRSSRLRGYELSDTRDESWAIRALGHGHWADRAAYPDLLQRFEELFDQHGPLHKYKYKHIVSPQAELNLHVHEACAVLARGYRATSGDDLAFTWTVEGLAFQFYLQYQAVTYKPAALRDLRQYSYRSEASNVGQTYLSSFAEFGPAPRFTPANRAVAQFLLEYAVRAYEAEATNPDPNAHGGIACLERTSGTGNRLYQAFRLGQNREQNLVGAVLSSATIRDAVSTLERRDAADTALERELYSRPRVSLRVV